nr:MAG TPA: hypothetical protein [Caudoviricetes sp.]
MRPLPVQGGMQRESGTFFVYKFSDFWEIDPFPVFYHILFHFNCIPK